MSLIIDVDFSVSSDAGTLTMRDDSTGWGEGGDPEKADIDVFSLDVKDSDGVSLLAAPKTDNILNDAVEFDAVDDFGFPSTGMPNGIYRYTVTYTYTGGPWTQTKNGTFYVTTQLEQNINTDLYNLLTGVKAFNYNLDFNKLEEIRRRDNLMYAVNVAEYLSDETTVTELIDYLERIE